MFETAPVEFTLRNVNGQVNVKIEIFTISGVIRGLKIGVI